MLSLLAFRKKEKQKDPELKALLERIQDGDFVLREHFIKDYIPFIIKSVSSSCGKFVEIENSEEFSIGLMAFNESIDCFDRTKNNNFFTFSDMVIKRRLINYQKQNGRYAGEIPFSSIDDSTEENYEEKCYNNHARNDFENIEISEEISIFKNELKKYGIKLEELVLLAPKHNDSRLMCLNIAKHIYKNDVLMQRLKKTRSIPIKDLLKTIDLHRGTIEKNRKYIISLCVIMESKLDIIKGFIKDMEKGGDSNE